MPKFKRNRAPERIDIAISHSTCVGLRPSVSLILGASTPSINQTLNINVKPTVDRVSTIQRDARRPGGGAKPMGNSPRDALASVRTGEQVRHRVGTRDAWTAIPSSRSNTSAVVPTAREGGRREDSSRKAA